jgi:methionine-rich copper-binding protein CopC
MEYALAFLALTASVFAAKGQTWDDSRPGHLKFTRWGWGALAVAAIAFILTIVVIAKKDIDQKKQSDAQQQQIENQKTQLAISEGIRENQAGFTKKQEEQLRISDDLTKKQEDQLKLSVRLTKELEDQLSIISELSNEQKRQSQLSKDLIAQQQEQVRRFVQMRLDRELVGVEISFKPSTDHWLRIVEVIKSAESRKKADESHKALEPPSPGVSYSAATIIAERVGRYWDIEFGPITMQGGSILPPPVSTESPEYKAFDDVIAAALVELFIDWGGDGGEEANTIVSARGNFPSAVKISKDEIAFILRPPKLRLILGDLYNNQVIKLRSKKYPATLRFRSLDYRVKFNDEIQMDWVRKRGEAHLEKWMPFVSGTHRLNIDWSPLLK